MKKSDTTATGSGDSHGGRSSKLPLLEGRDYYMEGGLMVFTSHYLMQRGYCCENGCRHCPYSKEVEKP